MVLANLVSHNNNQFTLSDSKIQHLNETLIHGIAENNKEALENIYARYFPSVLNYVLKNNGDESDARELFQSALIAFWMEIKEEKYFQHNGTGPGEYIFHIAKYKWAHNLPSVPGKSINSLSNYDSGKERAIEEKIRYLTALYRALGNNCREVLNRFYFERKTIAKISVELSVNASTLKRMKYQCMKKLWKLYRERRKQSQIVNT